MRCNCARVGRNCLNMSGLLHIGVVFVCSLLVLCCSDDVLYGCSWIIFGCSTFGGVTEVLEGCVTLGAVTSIVEGDGVGTMGGDCMLGVRLVGFSVALFKICANWTYALAIVDPYWRDGMLRVGSCKIANMS